VNSGRRRRLPHGSVRGTRERRLGNFRGLANSAALGNKTSAKTHGDIGFQMTCSIRYCRRGRREDSGLLIIARETEFAAYKARLEASGYVVLDNLLTPAVPSMNNGRPEANGSAR
jgi:hypothetical protein